MQISQSSSRRDFPTFRMMLESAPVLVRASHVCNVPWLVQNIILPLAKFIAGKYWRQRFIIHTGTREEVLASLERYHIPRDRVPRELGGTLLLDMRSFLEKRMELEMQAAAVESDIGRAPKKLKQESANKRRDSFDEAIGEVADLDV